MFNQLGYLGKKEKMKKHSIQSGWTNGQLPARPETTPGTPPARIGRRRIGRRRGQLHVAAEINQLLGDL